MSDLKSFDPAIYEAIKNEEERQVSKLEMIASENYVSDRVLEAQGCVMTNKYAEGYPGKRYYGGCEFVDVAEDLARQRAQQLFNVKHANVQPHSGSQANMAVYFAALEPGDTILGMDLSHGGHLTHGSSVNFSGRLYKVFSYGVSEETGRIDYDQVWDFAKKHRPKMIVVGASAYPRDIDYSQFRQVADEIEAVIMCDIAHPAGLIATGLLEDPVPFCEYITTTTHKTLRGPRGGMIMTDNDDLAKKVNSRVFPGSQGGPLMHVIAAKAVAFQEDLTPEYKLYTQQIINNAKKLASVLVEAGFKLVSDGTDNHLMLVDLSNMDFTGKDAEETLERARITVNKNTVPGEKRSPFVTSGIRIGTPALTTRGMKEEEMEKIGQWIVTILQDIKNEEKINKVAGEVKELCNGFPTFKMSP